MNNYYIKKPAQSDKKEYKGYCPKCYCTINKFINHDAVYTKCPMCDTLIKIQDNSAVNSQGKNIKSDRSQQAAEIKNMCFCLRRTAKDLQNRTGIKMERMKSIIAGYLVPTQEEINIMQKVVFDWKDGKDSYYKYDEKEAELIRIKESIKTSGLTMAQIARRLCVDYMAMIKQLNGYRKIDDKFISSISLAISELSSAHV